jgi:hypothetical protein
MFVVLKGLHDGNLCGEAVAVVFDGKTDDLVDAEFNGLVFRVLFVFGDMISWAGDASGVSKL